VILKILTYPNKKLKMVSETVKEFNSELHELLDNMNDTMIDKEGIGLASIQVGVPKRVFILNIPNEEDGTINPENLIEVINPEILDAKGSTVYEEGCLSLPKYYEEVKRADEIKVSFQNRYGVLEEMELAGLGAIAFQHELDHLNGKLFIERVSYLKRKKFDKEWKNKF
jgi:peptide deformylase